MKNKVLHGMRQRRDARDFARTMRSASPSMRQELMVAAARNQWVR